MSGSSFKVEDVTKFVQPAQEDAALFLVEAVGLHGLDDFAAGGMAATFFTQGADGVGGIKPGLRPAQAHQGQVGGLLLDELGAVGECCRLFCC